MDSCDLEEWVKIIVTYLGSYCVNIAEMCHNPLFELMETGLSGHGARQERVPLEASFEMHLALRRWRDGELMYKYVALSGRPGQVQSKQGPKWTASIMVTVQVCIHSK